jgi:lipopolysaccharide transport system permease protein
MLVFPIAIGLVILNLYWINLLVAITSARFRDFGPIVTSLMAVIFFVTPVLWRPNLLPPGTAHLLLGLNPLYHFLQLLRLPLSGELPTLENWLVSGVLAAVGIASASVMANKAKKSIASWL